MAEVDFSDFIQSKTWFETQNTTTMTLVANRAALRVAANLSFASKEVFDVLTLATMRSLIITAVHALDLRTDINWTRIASNAHAAVQNNLSISPHPAINSLLRTVASSTAICIGNSRSADHSAQAISSARSSAHTAFYGTGSVHTFAVLRSSQIFSGGNNLNTMPIWLSIPVPSEILRNHEQFLKRLSIDPKWSFWHDWYLAVWEGNFRNWKLAFKIIEILDEIWNDGPEAVATEIERIQAEHFTNQHPLAETIQLNPETNRFYATPTPIQNAPLIGTLLSRVQDSVEDATLGNNGLNDQSREVRVLSRTLTRYANDPQRIEMDFTSVAVGLRRQIHDTAELPNSEGNLALLEAVEDGVRGIRAAHPDVAKNRLLIAQQSLHELSSEHVDLLKDAQPVLVAISEEIMAEDFAVDIPSLINDALQPLPNGAPPLPGADAATRIFNRASHMRLMYGQFIENGSKAFDSKTFKTARLALTVTSMLSALVSLGLFLFGVI